MNQLRPLAITVVALAGCKPTVAPDPPEFHVTAVDECVSVTGTMGGVEYALSRPSDAPPHVACFGLVNPGYVGTDLPAVYDRERGVITVTMPDGYKTHYAVLGAREVRK